MTDLEKYCCDALRLSSASSTALLSQIQLNIGIARAELIRSGVSKETAEDDTNKLVVNCIIKYVISEMDSLENERIKAFEAFRLNMEELRKSVKNNA